MDDEANTVDAVTDDVRAEDHQEHENDTTSVAEKRARRMGWIPESEWDDTSMDHRPRKFLSADDYVEKVEGDLPILRERNRYLNGVAEKLEQRLEEATGKISTTSERVAELGDLVEDLHKQNVEVGRRAYSQAKQELEAVKRRAVSEADQETYDEAERRIDELEKYKPAERVAKPKKEPDEPKPAQQQQQASDAAIDWVKGNQTIWNDKVMNAAAVALHQDNINSGMTEAQSLAKLSDQVRSEFPHKFNNARRNDPPAVSGSSPPKRDSNKETFETLPADAQKTYDRLQKFFKAKGKPYTKETFAKSYFLNQKEQRAT